jgi:hypothetical protein
MNKAYLKILKGMNKMVINHIEKLFVTNDAATIMREIEVCLLPFQYIISEFFLLFIYVIDSASSSQTIDNGVRYARKRSW